MTKRKIREQALKRRVAEERAGAGSRRVRFSTEVRREAVALVLASGEPRDHFAVAMGIGKTSLHRWVARAQAVKTPRFKRMKLEAVAATPTPSMLALVFPSGARLVGLDVEQLRGLLGVAP